MNGFIQRMLGHYLMSEAEEGEDLPGQAEPDLGEEVDESDEHEEENLPEARGDSEEEGELVISLGGETEESDEPDENSAPQYVKDMRKRIREQNKELRELKASRQQAEQAQAPKAPEVGPKPKLSDDDIDYDEDVFAKRLEAWHDKKREADNFVAEQQKAAQKVQDDWNAKLNGYAEQKAQIKLPDYEDAEEAVVNTLSQTQQAIIISGASKPAHLIYALGKNSAKAKELAAITDPVKFAWAAAQLETQMKVEKKAKDKPAPERTVSGSAPLSSNSDAVLERLRAEAEKTGNYSKVHEYKRKLREKASA